MGSCEASSEQGARNWSQWAAEAAATEAGAAPNVVHGPSWKPRKILHGPAFEDTTTNGAALPTHWEEGDPLTDLDPETGLPIDDEFPLDQGELLQQTRKMIDQTLRQND